MTAHQLIIVEGLTGSGKSLLAHFIARQLQRNGQPARWLHEGETPHSVSMDVAGDITHYMQAMLQKWRDFVTEIKTSGQVTIIEASYFNNYLEALFTHNIETPAILAYAQTLQAIIAPLNPALIYFYQATVTQALEANFANRGERFTNFVIDYSVNTAYAQQRGLTGFAGMVQFWTNFAALTDALYADTAFSKLRLEQAAGDWDRAYRQVLDFLTIPFMAEPVLSPSQAARFTGSYHDAARDQTFTVTYEQGALVMDLFLRVKTRLIPQTDLSFQAEGWPFEVHFEADTTHSIHRLNITGRAVDYLPAVGTSAVRV